METIGQGIKLIRKKNRLTQQQLADGAGVQRGNLRYYERGKYNPSLETVQKIADFVSVDVDWLMFGTERRIIDTIPSHAPIKPATNIHNPNMCDDLVLSSHEQYFLELVRQLPRLEQLKLAVHIEEKLKELGIS